jgi:DNA-binding beta-propeller fold protein YncE
MNVAMRLCTRAMMAGCLLVAACDSDDEFVCDESQGVACIWAGTFRAGFNGDDLPLTESQMYWPVDVSFTSDGEAYVLDWNNHRVRRVTADGTFETVIGTDSVGDGDAAFADLVPPGVPGTDIDLNHPTQLLEAPDGSLVLVAWHNHKLRRFDPDTGLAYVICGRGAGFEGDGTSLDDTTRLNQPSGGVFAPDGSLYLLDQRNQRVRRIDADGVIETVVGVGDPGFAGDGGPPLEAQLSLPTGSNPQPAGTLTIDAQGRLYIADTLNHRIRRVDFAADLIETVVGDGEARFAGDGGPATQASIQNPRDLAIGPDGRLYIADELNHRVRAVDLDTGIITTVMGTGQRGQGEDGRAPLQTDLAHPAGVAFDLDGRLYVTDTLNNVIRRVAPEGVAQ